MQFSVANGTNTVPSSNSLSGLMKWLAKEPWRSAFLDVLNQHIGAILDEHDIPDFDDLGSLIGLDWAMTLWGCAFEDFLTKDIGGGSNIVDDYLKRRGWKESVRSKAYMTGLKNSVMSLYEISDIQPGRSFLARDLIRGGEPVRVSERTATMTLKPWDRVAMRIVDVRGTMIIGGGLLPFEHKLSEELIAAASIESRSLQMLAPIFSLFFLKDLLGRTLNPAIPQLTNSEGDDIEFIRLVYRLADNSTPAQVSIALNRVAELESASETFWNWVERKKTNSNRRKAAVSRPNTFTTTMNDGSLVLGTVELKAKTIELCVNSGFRADRGRKLLESLLDGLVGIPLIERQTLEQALAEHREHGTSPAVPELPLDEQRKFVNDVMDQHYRAQLDQPIPALGNVSPRKAAKSKKGRDKLVAWLKLLENHSARHDPDDPMASYDVTWMWEELGVSERRS